MVHSRKMAWLGLWLLLLCFFPLSASRSAGGCRYVTRVELTLEQPARQLQRSYRQPESISAVLSFLRLCRPRPLPPGSQPAAAASGFRIRLHFSDGGQSCYRVYGDRYFCRDGQPWQQIRITYGQLLYPLVHYLPPEP